VRRLRRARRCSNFLSSLCHRVLMEPSERSRRVLAAFSADIASGEPVASSLLVRAAGLGVSSATVRNVSRVSKTRVSSSSRTRRPDACRPIVAIGSMSTSSRIEAAPPGGQRRRGQVAPRDQRHSPTSSCRRRRTSSRRPRGRSALPQFSAGRGRVRPRGIRAARRARGSSWSRGQGRLTSSRR
jgi:hypothetical protein